MGFSEKKETELGEHQSLMPLYLDIFLFWLLFEKVQFLVSNKFTFRNVSYKLYDQI